MSLFSKLQYSVLSEEGRVCTAEQNAAFHVYSKTILSLVNSSIILFKWMFGFKDAIIDSNSVFFLSNSMNVVCWVCMLGVGGMLLLVEMHIHDFKEVKFLKNKVCLYFAVEF